MEFLVAFSWFKFRWFCSIQAPVSVRKAQIVQSFCQKAQIFQRSIYSKTDRGHGQSMLSAFLSWTKTPHSLVFEHIHVMLFASTVDYPTWNRMKGSAFIWNINLSARKKQLKRQNEHWTNGLSVGEEFRMDRNANGERVQNRKRNEPSDHKEKREEKTENHLYKQSLVHRLTFWRLVRSN